MEEKMEKEKVKEPSMGKEEDNNEENNEESITKLKSEIEKLKIVENKFKGMEKENEYQYLTIEHYVDYKEMKGNGRYDDLEIDCFSRYITRGTVFYIFLLFVIL